MSETITRTEAVSKIVKLCVYEFTHTYIIDVLER